MAAKTYCARQPRALLKSCRLGVGVGVADQTFVARSTIESDDDVRERRWLAAIVP